MLITIEILDIYTDRILAAFRNSRLQPDPSLTDKQLFEFVLRNILALHVFQSETKSAKSSIPEVPNDLLIVTEVGPSPPPPPPPPPPDP